ncbi:HIT family protein [Desulfovibrio gilichinskyi]|uniref:ATP adenylyltransferase n=1 Tax=Desulfovibrio gilichinskyi TaxID=1519643 RepID=A0A1X7CCS2_9BACT|nr:HIT domain-containing protein [Desulfovibrio gilichinskyi]SME93945.1 ATP adenylyltransferase [Desulfovibrio gilichinskyi]
MDVLWAPWRMDYILGPKPDECVFCIPESTDEDKERCILFRAKHCFVLLNKFPYNNGHIMVTPYKHVSKLTDLTEEATSEIMKYITISCDVLEKAFKPHGINVGLNIGEAAGAGIAAHLHFQLVPRWNGDASFMAVFGETTVIPQHLSSTYSRLKPLFDSYVE